MSFAMTSAIAGALLVAGVGVFTTPSNATQSKATQSNTVRADLGALLTAGKLRAVNREATRSGDGVHVSEKDGPGVVWLEGSHFGEGTIELDVRGRDVQGRSFVGVAFHRTDDKTYESVYLRPFNFRTKDATSHGHAVQYMAPPDFDWPRLRKDFPEEFERPVVQSIVPTDWVPLRVVVVKGGRIQVYVGDVKTPTLEARKLGASDQGEIGLWVGNNSEGDFEHLRITTAR